MSQPYGMKHRSMWCKIIVISLFFGLTAGTARADFDTGRAAYERGDYAAAYKEFLPYGKIVENGIGRNKVGGLVA